jgi:hypothetical protein
MMATMLGATASLVGCDRGAGTSAVAAERDSAGVAIVENSGALPPSSGQVTVATTLEFGKADGPREYQFGNIAGLDVADDGSIYVLDQLARHVRVFDSTGAYLRAMGGPGTGPGELSLRTAGLLLGLGDTVIVPDPGHSRVTSYTPDGQPARSTPINFAKHGLPLKWEIASGNRLVFQSRRMPVPGQDSIKAGDHLLVRASDGHVSDTLLALPLGESLRVAGRQLRVKLFEPEPMWAVDREDGRLYSGVTNEYSVRLHGADGNVERIIRKPFVRVLVKETDIAAFRLGLEELTKLRAPQTPPEQIRGFVNLVEFGSEYPAFAQLMAGPNGTLWVQHVLTPADIEAAGGFDIASGGAPRWDVFDRDGRYLGVVTLPMKFTPHRVKRHDIYGVSRDSLDVQRVVRLTVQGLPT